MKNRPTTTLLTALLLAFALLLSGMALAQGDKASTQYDRAPRDHPCDKAAAHNNTTAADHRCARERPYPPPSCRPHTQANATNDSTPAAKPCPQPPPKCERIHHTDAANNTTTARQRCAHDGPGPDAKCQRAAYKSDDHSALHARCQTAEPNDDRAKRCHKLARDGADWATLRAKCADPFDGTAKLGVLITEPTPNGPRPAAGIHVVIYKIERTDTGFTVDPVERANTNDHGHALFELPQGHYVVRAGLEGHGAAHKQIKLDDDKRVHLHLKQDRDHPDGPAALGIRAASIGDDGQPVPAANAKLVIQRYHNERADAANATWTTVAEGITDANGLYDTLLPPGMYRVKVVSEDGTLEGHHRFLLRDDKWVKVKLTPTDPTISDDA